MDSLQSTKQSRVRLLVQLSSVFSGTGNWLTSLVIFIWIFQTTGSAAWMSLGILTHRLPMILGSLFFSSQTERKPVFLHFSFDLIRGFILLIMVCIVALESRATHNASEALNYVIPFLILAGLRSFLSGADGALKAKIISSFFDKSSGASLQQRLQTILGLTGLFASILFIVGLKFFSFWEVLLFDAVTFFLSAALIRKIPESPSSHKVNSGSSSGLLAGLGEAPRTWHIIYLHTLRVAVASIPLQAALILLKSRFQLGPESTGYLYALVTLAWVASSELIMRTKIVLTPNSYLYGIVLMAVLSPILWVSDSLFLIGTLTFLLWFVDGLLLASVVGSLQRESGQRVVGRVFSAMTAASNIWLGLFALSLGILTDRMGPLQASIALGGLALCLLIVGELLIRQVFSPLGYFFFVRRALHEEGFKVSTHMKALPLLHFLNRDHTSKTNMPRDLSVGSVIAETERGMKFIGSGIQTGSKLADQFRAVQIGSVEAYERVQAAPPHLSPWIVYSNGVATSDIESTAKDRAYTELIERDTVLGHFVLDLPCMMWSDLKCESSFDWATKLFDTVRVGRLSSSDPNISVFQVEVSKEGKFGFGWSSSRSPSNETIEKALIEALAGWRIHNSKKIEERAPRLASTVSSLTAHNLQEIAQSLDLQVAEVQTTLVLIVDGGASRIKEKGSHVPLASLLASTVEGFASPPRAELIRIDRDFNSPLFTYRAVSHNALQPQWPFMNKDLARDILNERAPVAKIRDDLEKRPTLVF